jgi:hypothetical protein
LVRGVRPRPRRDNCANDNLSGCRQQGDRRATQPARASYCGATQPICDASELTQPICDASEFTRTICDALEFTRSICDASEFTRTICDASESVCHRSVLENWEGHCVSRTRRVAMLFLSTLCRITLTSDTSTLPARGHPYCQLSRHSWYWTACVCLQVLTQT